MVKMKSGAAGAVAAVLAVFASSGVFASEAFEAFAVSDEANAQAVSYAEFDEFLDAFAVRDGGRLNLYYSAMRPQGVNYLNAYTAALARLTPSKLSRKEQLAYWLNLRNALVIRAIAAQPPGRSLKDERWDGDEPGEMWTRKRLAVEGVSLSINDIEEYILLKNFDNPNLVYGLYQGVEGGPAMHVKGFTGAAIDEQLESIGRDYVNNRKNVRVRSGNVRVSLIYHWYKDALFDGSDADVISHIASLARPRLGENLADVSSISEQRFSYSLDEHEVRQQRPPQSFSSGGGGGVGRGS